VIWYVLLFYYLYIVSSLLSYRLTVYTFYRKARPPARPRLDATPPPPTAKRMPNATTQAEKKPRENRHTENGFLFIVFRVVFCGLCIRSDFVLSFQIWQIRHIKRQTANHLTIDE
jgi:hypothetical protein